MGKLLIASASLLLLAACASVELTGANERGGIVSVRGGFMRSSADQADAFNLANEHCKKFGRVARISGADLQRRTMTFDCISP